MLELRNISKVYKRGRRAVDQVTLPLGPGLVGLLGPNGAGKTSLLRVAATVTRPTSGEVRFHGEDAVARPQRLRRALGYLPQEFAGYPHLTGREFLSYLAAVKGLSARSARARVEELLALVNLAEAGKRRLGTYSGGMLRRVGVAQALLSDPQVLIVDEPTAGLDPQERVRFRNLLSDLAADRVVLLSTHIVSDLESVASDIAVLAAGRLRRRGSPEQLQREADGRVWELTVPDAELPAVTHRHPVTRMIRTGGGVRVRLLSPVAPSPAATAVPPDLEDAYLHLIHTPPGPDTGELPAVPR